MVVINEKIIIIGYVTLPAQAEREVRLTANSSAILRQGSDREYIYIALHVFDRKEQKEMLNMPYTNSKVKKSPRLPVVTRSRVGFTKIRECK